MWFFFLFVSIKGYFKEKYYGGINAFTKLQYESINGFSNDYYGWGAEGELKKILCTFKF